MSNCKQNKKYAWRDKILKDIDQGKRPITITSPTPSNSSPPPYCPTQAMEPLPAAYTSRDSPRPTIIKADESFTVTSVDVATSPPALHHPIPKIDSSPAANEHQFGSATKSHQLGSQKTMQNDANRAPSSSLLFIVIVLIRLLAGIRFAKSSAATSARVRDTVCAAFHPHQQNLASIQNDIYKAKAVVLLLPELVDDSQGLFSEDAAGRSSMIAISKVDLLSDSIARYLTPAVQNYVSMKNCKARQVLASALTLSINTSRGVNTSPENDESAVQETLSYSNSALQTDSSVPQSKMPQRI